MKFPSDFLFGYSNSAYQYEGNKNRASNIWDDFCKTPRKVKNKQGWETCCEGYSFLTWVDLEILKNSGLNAYRFSISWSRIFPKEGMVSIPSLLYYKRIIDTCRNKGIKTVVTLYHWDMPSWLYEKTGGFRSRDVLGHFEQYANACASFLSPDYWVTLNEPWCISYLGYYYGSHAPGLKLSDKELMDVIHNVNLSHTMMSYGIKSVSPNAIVGVSLNPYYAQCKDKAVQEEAFDFETRIFSSPLFKGEYPKSVIDRGYMPSNVVDTDLANMLVYKPDFCGINYYFENTCKKKRKFPFSQLDNSDIVPVTPMGWRIVPEGLGRVIRKLNDDFEGKIPFMVTENGYGSYDDRIDDLDRWEYVKAHIEECRKLIEEGIPLKGYFQWSLTDNFEWQAGFKPRFGGIKIDFERQSRSQRLSMTEYSNFVKEELNADRGS